MERRLHGDLAETDARWRPRILGAAPAARAAVRSRRPPPAQGVAAPAPERLHDAQPRQPARPASRRLGSGRRHGARLPALERRRGRAGRRRVDGIRHHRLDLGAGYPTRGPGEPTSRTTPGAPPPSPARSGRPSSTRRRAGAGTRRRSSGWRWASTWTCRSSTRSARSSTVRPPPARRPAARLRRDLDARTLSTARRDRGAHDAGGRCRS